jgi:hypothetical protein
MCSPVCADSSVSGVVSTMSVPPRASRSSALRRSPARKLLSRRITGKPRRFIACSWSAISAISGDTTTVGRSSINAGT